MGDIAARSQPHDAVEYLRNGVILFKHHPDRFSEFGRRRGSEARLGDRWHVTINADTVSKLIEMKMCDNQSCIFENFTLQVGDPSGTDR